MRVLGHLQRYDSLWVHDIYLHCGLFCHSCNKWYNSSPYILCYYKSCQTSRLLESLNFELTRDNIALFFLFGTLIRGFDSFFTLCKGLVNVGILISKESNSKNCFCLRVLYQKQALHRYLSLWFFDFRIFYWSIFMAWLGRFSGSLLARDLLVHISEYR